MRRCGKSSLLILTYEEILKRKCVDEKNILYFNFESLEYESLKITKFYTNIFEKYEISQLESFIFSLIKFKRLINGNCLLTL